MDIGGGVPGHGGPGHRVSRSDGPGPRGARSEGGDHEHDRSGGLESGDNVGEVPDDDSNGVGNYGHTGDVDEPGDTRSEGGDGGGGEDGDG